MLNKIKTETNHDLVQQEETKEKAKAVSIQDEVYIDEESIELFSAILANFIVKQIMEHESK